MNVFISVLRVMYIVICPCLCVCTLWSFIFSINFLCFSLTPFLISKKQHYKCDCSCIGVGTSEKQHPSLC